MLQYQTRKEFSLLALTLSVLSRHIKTQIEKFHSQLMQLTVAKESRSVAMETDQMI
uniref:Uncharacterized protein n=1 Tax=Panthera tigris altaica TaxID=74533 RepID=A0A8C9JA13_PANTA